MTKLQFLRLSIAEYIILTDALSREHRRELIGPAMICSVMANLKRDKKKRHKPFTIDDFLPPDPDKEGVNQREQTPEEMLGMFEFLLGQGQKQLPPPTTK